MPSNYEILVHALDRCNIYFNKNLISQELILTKEEEFLVESAKIPDHNSSLFLHTGSPCFNVVAFVISVFNNIIYDNNKSAFQDDIAVGDTVVYMNQLWKYQGKYEGSDLPSDKYYLLISQKDQGRKYITEEKVKMLIPYNGTAKTRVGKGLDEHKTTRKDFIKNILNIPEVNITSVSHTSTVIFLDNVNLDYYLENIVIEDKERHKEYHLLDLIHITFYTATREIRKSGNNANNEPGLKVTDQIDRARELIMGHGENEVIGFVALKEEAYRKDAITFEELFNRKKLRFTWLITGIQYNPWIESFIQTDQQDLRVLALTKEYLLSLPMIAVNEDNEATEHLCDELANSAYRSVKAENIESILSWQNYSKTKQKLSFIMETYPDSIVMTDFCRWAYSILKFFNNALFTMEEYENLEDDYDIPLKDSIKEYKKRVLLYDPTVKNQCKDIVDYLMDVYSYLKEENPKRTILHDFIRSNKYKHILIVVPSTRYKKLFEKYFSLLPVFFNAAYEILPEKALKNISAKNFDCVLFTSIMDYKMVNPFNINTSKNTVLLLYDNQIRLYKKIKKQYENYMMELNAHLYKGEVAESIELGQEDPADKVKADKEDLAIDDRLRDEFTESFLRTERYQAGQYFATAPKNEGALEVRRHGRFTSGEQILFTKEYVAYVIDSAKRTVVEKKVDQIEVGDELVFTLNDDKTKDIVEELLENISNENQEVREQLLNVKYWKSQLIELRKLTNCTYKDITNLFRQYGREISGTAIRQWLDPETHIVGPKEDELFRTIAQVVGNKHMEEHYLEYAGATSYIRKLRIKILKMIENAVVAEMNGSTINETGMFKNMMDKIREIAVIKQLDYIQDVESFKIQSNRANKPLDN